MTLRELIISVDSEQYSDSPLYQKLREIKPEYGSSRHIQVKFIDGKIAVTNAHVGSMGDILTYFLDEDAISNLCCQFPIPADYDGVGSKGTKFVFYL